VYKLPFIGLNLLNGKYRLNAEMSPAERRQWANRA